MSVPNKGFRHYRDVDHKTNRPATKGGVTIAYNAPKHLADITQDDKVEVAFAFCSTADNYERSLGRAYASKRLESGVSIIVDGAMFKNMLEVREPYDLLRVVYHQHISNVTKYHPQVQIPLSPAGTQDVYFETCRRFMHTF